MQETTLADLQQGGNNLQRELNERTGQLKALVKENFDHFISCKTTIDDIHKRLREAEKGLDTGNSSYVSTHDVIETVSEVGCLAPESALLRADGVMSFSWYSNSAPAGDTHPWNCHFLPSSGWGEEGWRCTDYRCGPVTW